MAKINVAKQQREEAKQADGRFGQPVKKQASVFDQASEPVDQVPPRKSFMSTIGNIGDKLSDFESLLESFEGNFDSSTEGKQGKIKQQVQSFDPNVMSDSMGHSSYEGTGSARGTDSMDHSSYEGTGQAYGTDSMDHVSGYTVSHGQDNMVGSMGYVSQQGKTSRINTLRDQSGNRTLKTYDVDANYDQYTDNDQLTIGSFKLNSQSLQQAFILAEVLGKRGGKHAWTKR